ncbi:branched-chain amino acid aminotransferase [Gulosibacter hominis]|uniref:branched-chain amino acid aminotransferase n=1 Tax=Gulosibacter hominis TaxID=2770504 RepID=UPI001917BA5C|nr:branched-chain amino acid aminotransferase [Gulosibacter hominis]
MTAANFRIERNPNPTSDADLAKAFENPGFGNYFTDHMAMIDWTLAEGWQDPRIVPYGPLTLNPANAVFHYGQEIFEGLKAYRHADGSVHTFRPERNAARLQASARRLALPELPTELFVEAIRQLVQVDERWVPPHGKQQSLYLRPFMIANEDFLGVRAAETATFMVIACPVGSYFSDPTRPVNIWLETEYSRAGRGGTGSAKCGGNYAASMLPQRIAYDKGCEQVLFLDSCSETYLEELGGMNVVLVLDDGTVITPKSDSILPGITRDSVLELCEQAGRKVERRQISIAEWREGVESGRVAEAIAIGTAAVISPIGELRAPDFTIANPPVTEESFSMRIRSLLTGIQNGIEPDTNNWLVKLV